MKAVRSTNVSFREEATRTEFVWKQSSEKSILI